MPRLLLDTQILVWFVVGDPRLSQAQVHALLNPTADLFVSAITAFEFTDLQQRGRIGLAEDIDNLQTLIGFSVLDWPADCWAVAKQLPDIHRDPIDRMLIAQAIHGGFTLVTADALVCKYPVETIS